MSTVYCKCRGGIRKALQKNIQCKANCGQENTYTFCYLISNAALWQIQFCSPITHHITQV